MSGALLPEQGDYVEAVLKAHAIDFIIDSQCDYSAEVECNCDWRGSAQDYRLHLMVALGLTSRVISEWETSLGHRGIVRTNSMTYTPEDRYRASDDDYLNLYRGPKDRVKVTGRR
jgi:hypothetical protein